MTYEGSSRDEQVGYALLPAGVCVDAVAEVGLDLEPVGVFGNANAEVSVGCVWWIGSRAVPTGHIQLCDDVEGLVAAQIGRRNLGGGCSDATNVCPACKHAQHAAD